MLSNSRTQSQPSQASTLSLVLLGQLLTTFMMDTLLQDAIPARLLNVSLVLFGVLLTGGVSEAIRSRVKTLPDCSAFSIHWHTCSRAELDRAGKGSFADACP